MTESIETLADTLREARSLLFEIGGLQPPGQTVVSAEDWQKLLKLVSRSAALAEYLVIRHGGEHG